MRHLLPLVAGLALPACSNPAPTPGRPPPATTPPPDTYGSVTFDVDGDRSTVPLDVRLLKQTSQRPGEEPQTIGWFLEGTEPAACRDTTTTGPGCTRLELRLPLAAGIGVHPCAGPDTSFTLTASVGVAYYDHTAEAGDGCTFDLTDDGDVWVSVQDLSVVLDHADGPVQVVAELGGEVW